MTEPLPRISAGLTCRDEDFLTRRWRSASKETSNDELLKEIDDAVTHERARLEHTRSDTYAENDNEDEMPDEPPDEHQEQLEEPALGRGAPRARKPPTPLYTPTLQSIRLQRFFLGAPNRPNRPSRTGSGTFSRLG